MRINDDFSRSMLIKAADLPWTPSPLPGVDRKMIFRVGEEVARATSIVRYAPGAAFSRHVHSGGEEILVLDGVFQDEHGDYPAGTYLRNPPGTSHAPASASGCTIFVRLWQFRATDRQQVVHRPVEAASAHVLFNDGFETVWMQGWPSGADISVENTRGLEILVVSGALRTRTRDIGALSWCRLPAGHRFQANAVSDHVRLWVRDAPLIHPDACLMA